MVNMGNFDFLAFWKGIKFDWMEINKVDRQEISNVLLMPTFFEIVHLFGLVGNQIVEFIMHEKRFHGMLKLSCRAQLLSEHECTLCDRFQSN